MHKDDGDDEEEVPSQSALVPLTFQQAAEHLRALRDFGLLTNQPQFIASICQADELLETEQCSKANCFKQTPINAFFIVQKVIILCGEFSVDRYVYLILTIMIMIHN